MSTEERLAKLEAAVAELELREKARCEGEQFLVTSLQASRRAFPGLFGPPPFARVPISKDPLIPHVQRTINRVHRKKRA